MQDVIGNENFVNHMQDAIEYRGWIIIGEDIYK